jgi:hypothetical protein
MPRNIIPRPDWYDKPHTEWPPAARTFCSILLDVAKKRLTEQSTEILADQNKTPAA